MRRPEEAGETAEERHSCEHRADEPADELSPGTLAGEMGEPVGHERLNARGGDGVQRLDDSGDGEAGCGSDGHPACGDPRARGHAHMTQAGTMRCRGTTPQDPRQADHRVQAGGVTITGQPRSPGHRRPGSAGTRSLAAAWAAVDPACHPDGDAGRTRRRHRRCLPRAAHRL